MVRGGGGSRGARREEDDMGFQSRSRWREGGTGAYMIAGVLVLPQYALARSWLLSTEGTSIEGTEVLAF